jgi:hypothetical protein
VPADSVLARADRGRARALTRAGHEAVLAAAEMPATPTADPTGRSRRPRAPVADAAVGARRLPLSHGTKHSSREGGSQRSFVNNREEGYRRMSGCRESAESRSAISKAWDIFTRGDAITLQAGAAGVRGIVRTFYRRVVVAAGEGASETHFDACSVFCRVANPSFAARRSPVVLKPKTRPNSVGRD